MLREIDLFMRGINLDLLDNIDPIFDSLHNLSESSNFVPQNEKFSSEKPKKNIAEILMTYFKMSEKDKTYEIDQILQYYHQF